MVCRGALRVLRWTLPGEDRMFVTVVAAVTATAGAMCVYERRPEMRDGS